MDREAEGADVGGCRELGEGGRMDSVDSNELVGKSGVEGGVHAVVDVRSEIGDSVPAAKEAGRGE